VSAGGGDASPSPTRGSGVVASQDERAGSGAEDDENGGDEEK